MKKLVLLFIIFQSLFSFSQTLFEGFENTSGPTLPTWNLSSGVWAVFDNGVGTTQNWGINTTTANVYAGLNSAYINRELNGMGATSEDYLATPLVTIPVNGQLRFFSRSFTAGDQGTLYQIKVAPASGNQNNPIDYSLIIQEFNESLLSTVYNIYEEKVINFPSSLFGQQVYIAFVKKYTQPSTVINGDRWLLDNISIVGQCLAPSELAVNSSSTSANLSWTGSAANYEIENILQGATPTGIANATATTNATTLTNLSPNTPYCFYIRSVCSGTEYSNWAGPFCYTTSTTPVCGGIFVDSGGTNGNYQNNQNLTYTICPTNPDEIVALTFTSFALENGLDYLIIYDGNDSNSPVLANLTGNNLPNQITSNTTGGCLTIVFTSNNSVTSQGWTANVTCAPAAICSKPTNVIVNNTLSETVSLSWTQPLNPDSSTATNWQVLALPCGSPDPTESTTGWTTASSNNNYIFTGLSPLTCYCFYARAVCSDTETSDWSTLSCATTLQLIPGCGETFTDSGGVSNGYQNNENITTTICPDNVDEYVTVNFTTFSTEAGYDGLLVYDGNSTSAQQIMSTNGVGNGALLNTSGAFWGNSIPGPFTSTNPTGCLTFTFKSDGSASNSGWTATVECVSENRVILNAFIDLNSNSIKDNGEPFFNHGNFLYDLNNSGNNTSAYSPLGNYVLNDSSLTNLYDFSYEIEPLYQAYYSSGTVFYDDISIALGTGNQTLYFPITLVQGYNDLSVLIIPVNSPNPGFLYQNVLIYKNNGNVATSGTLTFTSDSALNITNVSQSGVTSNPTGFTYDYSNLLPNETRAIYVTMSVPTIPTVNINDVLTTTASINQPINDLDLTNNFNSLSQIVIASYDPNDKTEAHGGEILYSAFTSEDYLYYTIRFENTGTAPAQNIRIEDVLDDKLDENSIRMLFSSHDYVVDRNENEVIWKFNSIQLPVSVPNSQIGKGYISFKIKPKPGFAIGDIIPNTAEIYFDFNPAIITNTFSTEFVEPLNTSEFTSDNFIIYPNPSDDVIEISINHASEIIKEIVIYDVVGKAVQKIEAVDSNRTRISISELQSGIYLVELTTSTHLKQVKKLVIK